MIKRNISLLKSNTSVNPDIRPEKVNYFNGDINCELYLSKDGLHGLIKSFYPNNKLKKKYFLKNGLRDGLYEEFYKNGNLELRAYYVNNNMNGLCEAYHDNGKLMKKMFFKNGLSDGLYEEFDENGILTERYFYKNDLRNGVGELYYGVGKPYYGFTEIYFINGVKMPPYTYEKLLNKTYTFEDFWEERNEDVKSAAIAYMQENNGEEYLANFFNECLRGIDTYVDKKEEKYLEGTTKGMNVGVYTLFKGSIDIITNVRWTDIRPSVRGERTTRGHEIAYVRCYCPSTDRMFYLGVNPIYDNAKDAIASLYRVPVALRNEIKSISRQGERFSTTFTERGLKILKTLDKWEISSLVSISGDEYFKKMKYEY